MEDSSDGRDGAAAQELDLESTASLLNRVRSGDDEARERLTLRYLTILRKWARGRLPAAARSLLDTDDIVQDTLVRALEHVGVFAPRREGAFLAYLRRILINEIRDELRRVARRPVRGQGAEEVPDAGPSALEYAIGQEATSAYETALAKLTEEEQEAVMLRIEMGFSHQQVAEALGKPSADAARMFVARALMRLAEIMDGR